MNLLRAFCPNRSFLKKGHKQSDNKEQNINPNLRQIRRRKSGQVVPQPRTTPLVLAKHINKAADASIVSAGSRFTGRKDAPNLTSPSQRGLSRLKPLNNKPLNNGLLKNAPLKNATTTNPKADATSLASAFNSLPHFSDSRGKPNRGIEQLSHFVQALNTLISAYPALKIAPDIRLSPLIASASDQDELISYPIPNTDGSAASRYVSAAYREDRLQHVTTEISYLSPTSNRVAQGQTYEDFSNIRRAMVQRMQAFQYPNQHDNAASPIKSDQFIILAQDRNKATTLGAIDLNVLYNSDSSKTRCVTVSNLLSNQAQRGVGTALMLAALAITVLERSRAGDGCNLHLDATQSAQHFYHKLGLTAGKSVCVNGDIQPTFSSKGTTIEAILAHFFDTPAGTPKAVTT